jgi:DNA-binding transcriptional LysR family regulator
MTNTHELWNLDVRHLAALAAIAETRSFSRAADVLGYGQSAVSQQLAALERVVGQRLVDRGSGPRPVTLTAAGATVLEHARWILDRLELAQSELTALQEGTVGSLRVGTFQSAGARLLPRVVAAYHRRWPDISVSIHNEGREGELPDLVREGALDVAFVEASTVGEGLLSVELMVDRFVALVPPGHRLATRRSISLSELDGEEFVDGSINDACAAKGEEALRDAGVRGRTVMRSPDNPTRQRLVHAGLGCAVQPGLTVEPGLPEGGVIVQLKEDLHRVISLTWSAERTPSFALERFIETAQSELAALASVRLTTERVAQPVGARRR